MTDEHPQPSQKTRKAGPPAASLALAMSVAKYFEPGLCRAAREVAKQVGTAVSEWPSEAARQHIDENDIDRMASALVNTEVFTGRHAQHAYPNSRAFGPTMNTCSHAGQVE